MYLNYELISPESRGNMTIPSYAGSHAVDGYMWPNIMHIDTGEDLFNVVMT